MFVSVNGKMDGAQYRATLEEKKGSKRGEIGADTGFTFQQSSSLENAAGTTEERFHLKNINVPGWPHQSPTLNPTENL